MKILFFDLECSNCYGGNGKVCEFGAVLVDEKFNIIREYDVPMSPGKSRECRFDMSFIDRSGGYAWAYDIDYYLSCPEFNYYYQTIKNLIEDEDTLVFGYAVDNDIRYLSSSIQRYHLNQLSYRAYDLQPIIKKYTKEKLQVGGLNAAFINFYGQKALNNLTPHLSRDDAKMTMLIVKKICENLEVGIKDLLELCPNCFYDSIQYLEEYKQRKAEREAHPELHKRGKTHPKSECQVKWGDFYRSHLEKLEDINSIGRIVTISSKIKEDEEVLDNTIERISELDLVAYDRISGSDYIVVQDEDDKNRLLGMLKHPYGGQIIIYKDFLKSQIAA